MSRELNHAGLDYIYSIICYKRLTSRTPLHNLKNKERNRYMCYLSCPHCKSNEYAILYCDKGMMLSTRHLPKNELHVSAVQYLATRNVVPTHYSLQDSEKVAGYINIR